MEEGRVLSPGKLLTANLECSESVRNTNSMKSVTIETYHVIDDREQLQIRIRRQLTVSNVQRRPRYVTNQRCNAGTIKFIRNWQE